MTHEYTKQDQRRRLQLLLVLGLQALREKEMRLYKKKNVLMKILERRQRSINVVVKAKMRKRWQMLEMKMMIAIKKPVLEFEYLDAQSL